MSQIVSIKPTHDPQTQPNFGNDDKDELLLIDRRLSQLESALSTNNALQKYLRDQLLQLEQNKSTVNRLQEAGAWKAPTDPRLYTKASLRAPDFFDPIDESTPANNEDVEAEIERFGRPIKVAIVYKTSSQGWKKGEIEALHAAVIQENRLRFYDPGTGTVRASEMELRTITDDLNWENVAVYVEGRTAAECEREYTVNQHPHIVKSLFKHQELDALKAAVEHYGARHWDQIALAVGNGRTPVQCFRAYQEHFSQAVEERDWTSAEDNALREAVNEWGSQWQKVAACLKLRTSSQCRDRWKQLLPSETLLASPGEPSRWSTGSWTAQEDERLRRGVELHGRGQWVKIARIVGTRSSAQCRERYERRLNPDIRTGRWTGEEVDRLRELYLEYGEGQWAKIGSFLGRGDAAVRKKVRVLAKHGYLEAQLSQEAIIWARDGFPRSRGVRRVSHNEPLPPLNLIQWPLPTLNSGDSVNTIIALAMKHSSSVDDKSRSTFQELLSQTVESREDHPQSPYVLTGDGLRKWQQTREKFRELVENSIDLGKRRLEISAPNPLSLTSPLPSSAVRHELAASAPDTNHSDREPSPTLNNPKDWENLWEGIEMRSP
ncbi:Myb-like DNA-binding domain protein [Gaertneriomyces sp. JEL0708]|nr:Myb-like DNA-binding domain protein [Gaertneriomyces sp. JEL0708]